MKYFFVVTTIDNEYLFFRNHHICQLKGHETTINISMSRNARKLIHRHEYSTSVRAKHHLLDKNHIDHNLILSIH